MLRIWLVLFLIISLNGVETTCQREFPELYRTDYGGGDGGGY
jgi:hypothetical protein